LNATTNVDRITDYSVADDTIRLENSFFSRFKVGAISFANFVNDTTGVAHDSNDYLIYERDTGNLYYDVNGSAAGGSILFAKLGLNLAVTCEDFIIV
jgi:serralysin